MRRHRWRLILLLTLLVVAETGSAELPAGNSPADHLPPHITRLTTFGERPDWSHDGKKILFLSKMFGDAMELDLASGQIRNLTAHYHHLGNTRAHYLANGDILLAAPLAFDPAEPDKARRNCYLFVLDKSLTKPPVPLGVRCNEGPAVSRKRMHIAWTEWAEPSTVEIPPAYSQISEADIVYEGGVPRLANQRVVLDSRDLPFRSTMESQNFRPPGEQELIFAAYKPSGDRSDVCGVDLATGKVTKYTDTPADYDEPEGIFPDGTATLVECDKQNHLGNTQLDLWKLALDGSGRYERLTFFSDYPGFKATNGVIRDDGRQLAFQIGKASDVPGVGHGLFIYDFDAAASERR